MNTNNRIRCFSLVSLVASMAASPAMLGCTADRDTWDSAEIDAIADALEDERAVTDADDAAQLYEEVEALPQDIKDEVKLEIDRRVSERISLQPLGADKSAQVPVDLVFWLSSPLPSHVGTTPRCGGDLDFQVVYSNIPGAYSNPGALRLQTDSLSVYAITSFHGNRIDAYRITDANQVNLCIGMKDVPGTTAGESVQYMFRHRLGLYKSP
ncbi:hypothetical protein [Chondromyces apiculatus]|uniref:Lipoprotein n=1 Tax=Chondromyces apiculatus DSM 436 TaxID=1192034 RepID=A0A017SU56_9BACT|nr:hypothetical protein [Chondromyces apiculatus]EYF00120.1 Hypothetical protein CAP_1342 [Chondromyces apiculatus DSM 436]